MDYGIISLLILQLAACMGCLVAWVMMRRELDTCKTMQENASAAESSAEARVQQVNARIATCEEITRRAHEAAEDARKKTVSIVETVEANSEGIKSLRAKMAAAARWSNREEETDPPVEAPPSGLPWPQGPALTPEPPPSTFGRKAV